MIFSILHFIYNLTDGAGKNKNPKRTLLKKIQLKGRTFNCAVEFHHQGQGSEYLNTTPEAVQRLRKVLILSEHYDHHDYSDTLSITRPVITLYPFIPVRLPFSSTSLTLSLSCRQTGTHAQTHAHTCTQTHKHTQTDCVCMGQCGTGGCRLEQRSAAPCYYPQRPVQFKGSAVVH